MKAIVQRVISASVTVENQVVSSIANGLLVLAAVSPDDTSADISTVASRILKLKTWDSLDGGRWKSSVLDLEYQVLLVSQFTLLASTRKGNKPDFHGACEPELAKEMYGQLLQQVRNGYAKEKGLGELEVKEKVQDGVFGAMMQVALVNDGPVTLEIATAPKEKKDPVQDGKNKGVLKQKGKAKITLGTDSTTEEEKKAM